MLFRLCALFEAVRPGLRCQLCILHFDFVLSNDVKVGSLLLLLDGTFTVLVMIVNIAVVVWSIEIHNSPWFVSSDMRNV